MDTGDEDMTFHDDVTSHQNRLEVHVVSKTVNSIITIGKFSHHWR